MKNIANKLLREFVAKIKYANASSEETQGASELKNHGNILKSTAIMGGSAILVLIFNLIKTKIAAVTVGKLGLGLIATYTVIQSLLVVVFSLGLPMGALRSLVSAFTDNNIKKFVSIIKTTRRLFLILALLGAIVILLFSSSISTISFGNLSHKNSISWLSLVVFFSILAAGELLVLQGMSKVFVIGKINIMVAFFTCIVSACCYLLFGNQGIMLSLVMSSLLSYLISLYFARQGLNFKEKYSWKIGINVSKDILIQGLCLLASSLLFNCSAYLINIVLQKNIGLEGVGLYTAIVSISGMLINFILNAMATDYYPRLIAVSHDKIKFTQYINDQIEVGLTIATPGLIALIIFAPLLVIVFYAEDYLVITDTLRLYIFGYFFKIVSWPLGFALLAKNLNRLYLITEILGQFILIITTYYFVCNYALLGTAVALLSMYGLYFLLMLAVLHKFTKFKLNKDVAYYVTRIIGCFTLSMCFIFLDSFNSSKYFLLSLVFIGSLIESYIKMKKMNIIPNSAVAILMRKFRV